MSPDTSVKVLILWLDLWNFDLEAYLDWILFQYLYRCIDIL